MSVTGGNDGDCREWYRAALTLGKNHERVAKLVWSLRKATSLMPPPSAVVPERGTGIYCGEEAGDEVARGALTARILVME